MAKKPEKKKAEAKKPATKQPVPKKGGPMHLPVNAAPHGDQSHNRDWAGKPPPKKFSIPRK